MPWMDSRKFLSVKSQAVLLPCTRYGVVTGGCVTSMVSRPLTMSFYSYCKCRKTWVVSLVSATLQMISWCTASVIDQKKQKLILIATCKHIAFLSTGTQSQAEPNKNSVQAYTAEGHGTSSLPEMVLCRSLPKSRPFFNSHKTSKSTLQWFLGTANYLNVFCPNVSSCSIIHPLFS